MEIPTNTVLNYFPERFFNASEVKQLKEINNQEKAKLILKRLRLTVSNKIKLKEVMDGNRIPQTARA